jgi:hypothetical protein
MVEPRSMSVVTAGERSHREEWLDEPARTDILNACKAATANSWTTHLLGRTIFQFMYEFRLPVMNAL